MNYLADFNLYDELQDAIDNCLVSAFLAGAEWQREHVTIRARVENGHVVNVTPISFEIVDEC